MSNSRHISASLQILEVDFGILSQHFSCGLQYCLRPPACILQVFHDTGLKGHPGVTVLRKCANPACSNRFRHLNRGKLFQLETQFFPISVSRYLTPKRKIKLPRRVEHYWLCDPCSLLLTLAFDKGRGMITVPRPAAIGNGEAASYLTKLRAAVAQT